MFNYDRERREEHNISGGYPFRVFFSNLQLRFQMFALPYSYGVTLLHLAMVTKEFYPFK